MAVIKWDFREEDKMKYTLKQLLLILLSVVALPFLAIAQENKTEESKAKPSTPKSKVETQKNLLIEFSDYSSLTSAQKKHLAIYNQQYELQKSGKYNPKKCFTPIYTPMAEYAKQLRPMALDAADKAQKMFEKLTNENKHQMAKRIKMHYNAYMIIAKQCEVIEKAFNDKKAGELEEALVIIQRQMMALKQDGQKVPNREWLNQKEANLLISKMIKQKKAAAQGVPQGGVRQQPNVRPQTNGNK